MNDLKDARQAIRHLLRERDPADAMAAYYALYHPEERVSLVLSPQDAGNPPTRADGYVALAITGIDLFRPFITMRLPTDHDPAATQAAANLLRRALEPGQEAILNAPMRYRPLVTALFDIHTEDRTRLYALNPARFQPVINVLVTRSAGLGNLPRFTIRSAQSGQEELVADASLNWQSPHFAEIAVNTRAPYRRQGWGRSVVAAMCAHLLESGRTPLYVVSEENIASIQLAESVGFEDTGVREFFIEAALKER
jgi:RimJ/RimL family protein N-acetyltransferase